MPLIGKVGRKDPRVLLGIALIYILLIVGGTTMVYPFLITLTSSMTNDLDYERFSPYPRFWFDKGERYLKFLAEKYADVARFDYFKAAYRAPAHWGVFRDVAFDPHSVKENFPVFGAEEGPDRWVRVKRIGEDYYRFIKETYRTREETERVMPLFLNYNLPDFQNSTQERYQNLYLAFQAVAGQGDLARSLPKSELERQALSLMGQFRADVYDAFINMNFTSVKNYAYDLSKWIPAQTTRHVDFIDWVRGLPPEDKLPVTRHYLWTKFLFDKGWDMQRYNAATGAHLTTLLAAPYPTGDVPAEIAALREEFVRERWPIRLTRLKGDHRAAYMKFMQERYPTIASLNKVAGSDFKSWDEVPHFEALPYPHENTLAHEVKSDVIDALSAVWRDYAASVSPDQREMLSAEKAYQDFLLKEYGSLETVNQAYGWSYAGLEEIELPIPEADYCDYVTHRLQYCAKFVGFNFGQVVRFIATKGRALWNTAILVLLTIAVTLTVNPLAAYALSRFQLRATPKILLFLLATMAFPPEVAMIPSFLLLRNLGLLNTFGALVLPGLANGFSIFLLKGFFDSLPRELYEAASIDGASELRMFTTITLPLTKPILAVIALGAFLGAYGGFMWAFLVCQNQKMWTLMVWLYQFQQTMAQFPYMTMAALVLASIPTLLVFLTCQNIILRGIIIPTMK